jgi:hypothetical protein
MKMKMFAIFDKEKPNRKYMRLKLGCGHVHNSSSVWVAVVA